MEPDPCGLGVRRGIGVGPVTGADRLGLIDNGSYTGDDLVPLELGFDGVARSSRGPSLHLSLKGRIVVLVPRLKNHLIHSGSQGSAETRHVCIP